MHLHNAIQDLKHEIFALGIAQWFDLIFGLLLVITFAHPLLCFFPPHDLIEAAGEVLHHNADCLVLVAVEGIKHLSNILLANESLKYL